VRLAVCRRSSYDVPRRRAVLVRDDGAHSSDRLTSGPSLRPSGQRVIRLKVPILAHAAGNGRRSRSVRIRATVNKKGVSRCRPLRRLAHALWRSGRRVVAGAGRTGRCRRTSSPGFWNGARADEMIPEVRVPKAEPRWATRSSPGARSTGQRASGAVRRRHGTLRGDGHMGPTVLAGLRSSRQLGLRLSHQRRRRGRAEGNRARLRRTQCRLPATYTHCTDKSGTDELRAQTLIVNLDSPACGVP